ncbi:glycoside hydrolase family 31 protein [Xylona heveae TC161]|uniref:alpha-glucosidase n=1 Tax=Xylona heveae (strain CBS 132557 / TC161) TaxID=1328760 RepID=A0A164ZGM1_XYLHT|nr:glycoside hydrolase family 31 protein [Xylona heveae TC161]KZF19082.1 glycoside hydrolase family 31 protein [Xylona heveae TC161]
MNRYTFPSRPKANPKAIVSGTNYRFTVLTDRLIRYEWAEDGRFQDQASTFAINREFPRPEFKVVDRDDLEIITEHFHLSYDKKRFSPGGLVVNFNAKITEWGATWRFGAPPELNLDSNLGGTARTLDLCDGRCDIGQGVLSRGGYAELDDSKSMLFDGKGFVANRPAGDRVDGYLFCYGLDYKAAIKAFYALSGKQPVLPRYALGNWWSRYYAYQQDEYIELMDDFRARDIPFSVAVIDMDWHLVSDERVPHAGWTGYTWDDKLIPEPKRFGRELHDRNVKITLNDHPHAGIHSHEKPYEEMARFLGHSTKDKNPILFDCTGPKFLEAYFGILHRSLEKVACDFWWIDWQQGAYSKVPGIDPLWMLNHFHYVDHALQGNTPLIFSRYAGPGSHRYPVGFSGDTVVTWASLQFQPEFTATASNIGYGWWSHDIGGHIFGARDDELVTRWFQLGVFSPIMRLHSSNSRWMSKEPWLYRKECERVMTGFLRFRHRMVPYLYTRNVICSTDDEPLIQPLYWSYPGCEEAYSFPNQYFFGNELVVAPIVQPRDQRTGLASVKAWLPPLQRHVDIFTGTIYDGDAEVTLYRTLENYPVLAHEGSIIPLDADAAPRNGCLNPDAFEVLVVIGRNGQAVVLEDSGDDASLHSGVHKGLPNGVRNGVSNGVSNGMPKEVMNGLQKPSRAQFNGQRRSTIQYTQAVGKLTATVTAGRTWSFRFLAVTSIPKDLKVLVNGTDRTSDTVALVENFPKTPSLLVQFPSGSARSGNTYEIAIELGPNPQLSVIDHKPRIEHLIMGYQTEFKVKDQLWEVVENLGKRALNVTVARLMALGYDEGIIGPIAELLLADSRVISS